MVNFDLNEFKKVFKGRKVFITGHTGFKGSWLTFILNEIGANVTGFALPPKTGNSHFDLLKLQDKINHIEGDIRDFSFLNKCIKRNEPEFVFHLAAQAIVRESYSQTLLTLETNILGSANLLESVRYADTIRALVFITSDKCYENVEKNEGYVENDTLGGIDPYSASKAAAEIIYSSYNRSFFLNKKNFGSATARAGNVIGGGDWSNDRIIPDCVRSITNKKPIVLRNPKSTRPWQHVLEPVSGYLTLAKLLTENPIKYNGSWNFGPSSDDIKTVKNVTDYFFEYINRGSLEIDNSDKNLYEANLLQLNCDKAKNILGWTARWRFKKTIDETAEWYKFVMNGGLAENITRKQVEDFFKNND